ncbi:MAG: type II restriction endonuclease subunit M [Mesorhizobium sp.]|uniref:hypothetical protein n=1 Tax=Mesorhizobium sp. TaxID=1871066 RepID=UPI00120548FA|nr:hypothetical protein [Mesorhizobium sp.]TIL20467.1 MAG: type II restriction endonuclease subunit M [Mesorhizobium sp.]
MTIFIRLLSEIDKSASLLEAIQDKNENYYDVDPISFLQIPGAPFAYWVSHSLRARYLELPSVEGNGRSVKVGVQTFDDMRFVRASWEVAKDSITKWVPFPKGGAWSPFYSDVFLEVNFHNAGREMSEFKYMHRQREGKQHRAVEYFFRPGLTWPRRTNGLSFRVMPRGCIFADKGPAAFDAHDSSETLLSLCAIVNSQAFGLLAAMQLARTELAQSFEVGLIQKTPVPDLTAEQRTKLASMAGRAWSLRRSLDTVSENSHAFLLPLALRTRICAFDPPTIDAELAEIQSEINEIAFNLFGFSELDRAAALRPSRSTDEYLSEEAEDADDNEVDHSAAAIDQTDALLSWAVGVAFGRFDWRLAAGEREAPAEPDPFEPLPAKSPGMLPDGGEPFHPHHGILVDDQGHPHDLPRLIEEIVARVDAEVPGDVRRWLQRDFFPLHLKQYSKSRRKAPIYWPLSTASGSYTLWLYYPSLTSQTLYTAVNDFIEPKLKQVGQDVGVLRTKGSARSRDDEKSFEALQALELELIELRDILLQIAPTYRPNHDDGVQITAAPLWQLFRHKPWQKILKDTWALLEKGDYDWAHLALAYWPDRVREKCKTDKSLAIAHDLEELYIEPVSTVRPRGKKTVGGNE